MHPIEHLRYVARARGADPAALVRETAQALSAMRFDPSGLVVACRRILERHPECGPLWWLCARLLADPEPFELARRIATEIDRDPTAAELAAALPDGATVVTIGWPDVAGQALTRRGDVTVLVVDSRHDGSGFIQRLERCEVPCEAVQPEAIARAVGVADVVVVETVAACPGVAVAPIGSAVLAAVGSACSVPVWLVAGLGRRLPAAFVDVIADRVSCDAQPWELDHDVFDPAVATHLVCGDGVLDMSAAALRADCAQTSELLRSSPI